MGVDPYGQGNWHYVFLPPFLIITMLIQTPPSVSGFSHGTQIRANFRMYCNRPASHRFPVHADVMRCGGFCVPRNDVRNLFTLRVNASSYYTENIPVSITANPEGGTRNNIRGFALIAMTENETIVGSFLEQPDALIASCDPLMEGDTAFHAHSSTDRRSVTLIWQPEARNYGRVRFRAWIVVHHYEIYMLNSEYLDNEISGSRQYDVVDNFYTFILQVFNISRSAATILSNRHYNHTVNTDNNSLVSNNPTSNGRVSNDRVGRNHANSAHASKNLREGEHSDHADVESDGNSVSSRTVAVSEPSFTSVSSGDDTFMQNDITGSLPTLSISNSLFHAIDVGGGRNIVVRRENLTSKDLISRFTTIGPPVNSIFTNHADNNARRTISKSSVTRNTGHFSDRSSSSSSNSRKSSNSGSSSNIINNRNGSNINSNSSSSNSSMVQVLVSLVNGQSMELTIPSLTAFEEAFERRLMTTGFDISAKDPFHQLKQDVPTFRDLFPQPLPTSTSALSASSDPSGRNPFFQTFGSLKSTSSSSLTNRLSPATRIHQIFHNLLPAAVPQTGSRLQGQNMDRDQFTGLGGTFGQVNQRTNGRSELGFPANTNFIQRPNTSGRFTRTQTGFRTNSGRTWSFPSNDNAFHQVSGNTLSGNQFLQQVNNRTVGALLSHSQRNLFSVFSDSSRSPAFRTFGNEGISSRNGFPDTSSLLGRFSQTVVNNEHNRRFGQNGAFASSDFTINRLSNEQNPGIGSLQMQNLRNRIGGRQISVAGQPNLASNFFTQQTQTFFGQQNNIWSRLLPQQLLGATTGQQDARFRAGSLGFTNSQFGQFNNNPFSVSRRLQSNMAHFARPQQSGINLFNRAGNAGFQPQSGSANPFSGNFPTSSASLLGGFQNPLNSFSNPAFAQNGNIWHRGSGFNSLTSSVLQARGSSGERPFNPLRRTSWFEIASTQQEVGPLGSRLFPNRFPTSLFSAG